VAAMYTAHSAAELSSPVLRTQGQPNGVQPYLASRFILFPAGEPAQPSIDSHVCLPNSDAVFRYCLCSGGAVPAGSRIRRSKMTL